MGYRPSGFTELIIQNWLRLVGPQDTVIHLGDVIVGKQSELPHIMSVLPGTKYLVRGNHDKEKEAWYLKRGFSSVSKSLLYCGPTASVLLTHKPADGIAPGVMCNVHGHLHDSNHHADEFDIKPWHRLLAIENTNYCPVEIWSFLGLNNDNLHDRPLNAPQRGVLELTQEQRDWVAV